MTEYPKSAYYYFVLEPERRASEEVVRKGRLVEMKKIWKEERERKLEVEESQQ